jgi:hypothetical protein
MKERSSSGKFSNVKFQDWKGQISFHCGETTVSFLKMAWKSYGRLGAGHHVVYVCTHSLIVLHYYMVIHRIIPVFAPVLEPPKSYQRQKLVRQWRVLQCARWTCWGTEWRVLGMSSPPMVRCCLVKPHFSDVTFGKAGPDILPQWNCSQCTSGFR